MSSGLCSSLRSLLSLGARLRGVVHSRVRAHPTRRHRAVAIVRSCRGRHVYSRSRCGSFYCCGLLCTCRLHLSHLRGFRGLRMVHARKDRGDGCSGRVGVWGFLRDRGLGNGNCRLGMGSGPTTQGFNFRLFGFTFTRRDSNEGVVRAIPTRFEECTKLDGCFLSQNSGNDLDLVIEARITKNIAQRPSCSSLGVPCAKDDAVNTR